MAGAALMLEQANKVQAAVRAGKSWGEAWQDAPPVDAENPPEALIAECRREILDRGIELYVET
jgi:hypothetical protein